METFSRSPERRFWAVYGAFLATAAGAGLLYTDAWAGDPRSLGGRGWMAPLAALVGALFISASVATWAWLLRRSLPQPSAPPEGGAPAEPPAARQRAAGKITAAALLRQVGLVGLLYMLVVVWRLPPEALALGVTCAVFALLAASWCVTRRTDEPHRLGVL